MIDISTLAPVATSTGTASPGAGSTGPTTAAGFLRLFEIVLGGIPKGSGGKDTDADLSQESSSQVAGALLDANAQAGLVAESGVQAGGVASATLAGDQSALTSQADRQITSLLQAMGFDVKPGQIAQLGPLDRAQLDQAMEFLQRGIQSGMPIASLLENASFLLPREWSYDGGAKGSSPRSKSLAPVQDQAEAQDAGQILAATESVRQILAISMQANPFAAASTATPQATSKPSPSTSASMRGDVSATPSPSAGGSNSANGSTRSPASQPGTSNALPTAAAMASESTPASVEATISRNDAQVGKSAAGHDAPAIPSTDTPLDAGMANHPPRAPGHRAGLDQRPVATNAVAGEPVQASKPSVSTPQIAMSAKPSGNAQTEIVSQKQSATAAVDAASRQMLASTSLDAGAESRATGISQGVKPGSMASEFIGRQVLEKVDVHLKQGQREISVRLWPEELGEVRLSLRVGEADKLDARIMVQTESVKQAILDATPQLREALARHGMDMGRLSVSVDSGRSETSLAGGGRRENDTRDGNRPKLQRGWVDEELEYAAPLALGVDSGIRDGRNTLDMWS